MLAPQSLDALSNDWKNFLSVFPVSTSFSGDKHVPGKYSVYVLKINLYPKHEWYYIGQSHQIRIQQRLNQHKSEFLCCKTTTRTGKSSLYDPSLYDGVKSIILDFEVKIGGLTKQQALQFEAIECANYKISHGEHCVLTNSSQKIILPQSKVQTTQPIGQELPEQEELPFPDQ